MPEPRRRGSDYGAPPALDSPALAQFSTFKSQLDQIVASMAQVVYFLNEENKSLRRELEARE